MKAPSLKNFWLLTFTDLISLMLTFFVMLFAMSSDTQLPHSSNSYVTFAHRTPNSEQKTFELTNQFGRRIVNLDYLYFFLKDKLSDIPNIPLYLHDDALALSLPSDVFIDNQVDGLKSTAFKTLHKIGYLLNNLSNEIYVITTAPKNIPALSFSAVIANELKNGGYAEFIPVFSKIDDTLSSQRIEIVISPYQKEGELW